MRDGKKANGIVQQGLIEWNCIKTSAKAEQGKKRSRKALRSCSFVVCSYILGAGLILFLRKTKLPRDEKCLYKKPGEIPITIGGFGYHKNTICHLSLVNIAIAVVLLYYYILLYDIIIIKYHYNISGKNN